MAPVDRGDDLRRRPPALAPSAVLELLWLGDQLLRPQPDMPNRMQALGPERAERLARELNDFWGDGHSAGVGELVILADLSDQLFATDLDGLLPSPPALEGELPDLGLRSEDPSDRARFIERLGLLQRRPKLRARYGRLLQELWAPFREEWETKGLPQVLASCHTVARRMESGTALEEAVPVVGQLVRKRAGWGLMVSEAADRGRLALVPSYFGGSWSLWDLPHHLVVGFNEGADPIAALREEGRLLAPRLRVLGDPTRLSLLLYLADRPTSVGELAARFGLAQPTVSAHLHTLREAALVTPRKEGSRTLYRAERAELARLLRDVASGSGVDLGS